jgi:serine/threonine protein phosphatase PrpC
MTSAKQACETLLEEALEGGGSDNITIVIGRAVPAA